MSNLTHMLTFAAAAPRAVQAAAVPAAQGSSGFAHVLSRALPSSTESIIEDETAQDAESTGTDPEGSQDAKTPARPDGTATRPTVETLPSAATLASAANLPSSEVTAGPESARQEPPGEAPQAGLTLEGSETAPGEDSTEADSASAQGAGEVPDTDAPVQSGEERQSNGEPASQPPGGRAPASESVGDAETLPQAGTPDAGPAPEADTAPQADAEPGIEVSTGRRDTAQFNDTAQANETVEANHPAQASAVPAEPVVSAPAASGDAKLASPELVAPQESSLPGTPRQAQPEPAATGAQPTSAQAPIVLQASAPAATPAPAPTPSPAASFAATAQPLNTQLAGPVHQMLSGGEGSKTLTLNVAPEHVGPVTVRANFTPEGVRIELFAPQDAGREALRGMLGDLRRDLAGLGMSTGTSSLSVSDSEAPGQNSTQGQQRGMDQQPGSASRQADQHTDPRAEGLPRGQGAHANPTDDHVQRSDQLRPHTPGEHLDLFA